MPRGYNTITQRVRYRSERSNISRLRTHPGDATRANRPPRFCDSRLLSWPGASAVKECRVPQASFLRLGPPSAKPQSPLAQSPGHSAWRLSVLNSISAVPC